MDNTVGAVVDQWCAGPSVVFVDDLTGYAVYEDNGNEIRYMKTVDGGANWTAGADIGALHDKNKGSIALWHDRWTPGDVSGTKIHIVTIGQDDDEIYYNYIDTAGETDTFGTWVAVTVNGTDYNTTYSGVALTKGADGKLYTGAIGNFGAANTLFIASSSDGVTWTSIGGAFGPQARRHPPTRTRFSYCP